MILDDEMDDLFDKDEDDDFEDEDFDDLDDYEDELKDLIYETGTENGYFYDDEEDYNDVVEDIAFDLQDYFIDLVRDYDGDVDEALEDDDLLEKVEEALEEKAECFFDTSFTDDEKDTFRDNDSLVRSNKEQEETCRKHTDVDPAENISMFSDNDLKYSRKSFLNSDYDVSKDSKGSSIGHKRKNMLFGDVTNHYDNKHNITGYSRKSLLNDMYTNYYDKKGNKIGYSRKSFLNDMYTNYYDNKGNYIGSSRKDLLTGDYQKYFKKKK